MKKISTVLIVLVAVLLVFSFLKDSIIKASVEKGTELVTGLQLNIKKLNVGIFTSVVDIKGLRLHNPKGFPDKIMLNMPEIYVKCDLKAIMNKNIHLEELRIHMQEFTVVKDSNGNLNLDSLRQAKKGKKGTPSPDKKAGQEKGEMPKIQIDKLKLKIGKVVYKDYSKGGTPSVQDFEVGIDKQFENITDPNQLVSLIVNQALIKTSIARLTNFDISVLSGLSGGQLESIQVQAQAAAKQAQAQAQAAAKQAQAAVKQAAQDLTSSFKLPFGSSDEEN